MSLLAHRQPPLSSQDVALARASGQALSQYVRRERSLTLHVQESKQNRAIELPAGTVALLINSEWIEALMRNEPLRDRRALERTRDLMDRAVRDCLVTGYEPLITSVTLPDAGDRHVHPPYSADEYLDTLARQGLVTTVARLEPYQWYASL